jgi:hypothetical protein
MVGTSPIATRSQPRAVGVTASRLSRLRRAKAISARLSSTNARANQESVESLPHAKPLMALERDTSANSIDVAGRRCYRPGVLRARVHSS